MQSQQWVDLEPGLVWPGDVDDFVRLLCSVGAHCTCRSSEYLSKGWRSCPAHQLLADQHELDHLVFARRIRARLIRSEWTVEMPPPSEAAYMRLLRRLTNRGQARPVGWPRKWRSNAFAYALAGLLIMIGLSGTLPSAASHNHAPITTWQNR